MGTVRIRDSGEAATDQGKERISRKMLADFGRHTSHGTPHHEHITSLKSGDIFASKFTKGQCSSPGDYWAWRLSGNCCQHPNSHRSATHGGSHMHPPQGISSAVSVQAALS